MRKWQRLAWALGCLTATEVAVALAGVSCGSSTATSTPEDAGGDTTTAEAGEDAGNDAAPGQDSTADTGPGTDSGTNGDTGTGAETGTDADATVAADTGADGDAGTAADTSSDVNGEDASDGGGGGGDADAGLAPDASAMFAFPGQVADAFCNRIQTCCGLGSSSFNLALCRAAILSGGGYGITKGTDLLDGGNVVYSASAAQACINRILAIDCALDTITTQQATAILAGCFTALQGTLEAGAPCNGSIECAPNEFCYPADGGVGPSGTCIPLRTSGQPCGDFGGSSPGTQSLTADNACSYRSSGNTGLFCDYTDLTTPTQPFLEAGAWQCAPQHGLDAGCFTDIECQTFVCSTTSPHQCVNARTFVPGATCTHFTLPDAGSD